MNFLQLLASGASILNFNFQSKASQSVESFPKTVQKTQGFQKVTTNQMEQDASSVFPSQIPNSQSAILNQILQTERQQLINRYLQLNIQLLQGKLSTIVSNTNEEPQVSEALDQSDKLGSTKKKIKKVSKCEHHDRAHYAKGLCNNCYHKYGRTKKPWNCPHDKLYAGGMCQNCYINDYNKRKRDQENNIEQVKGQVAQWEQKAQEKPQNSYLPYEKPARPTIKEEPQQL